MKDAVAHNRGFTPASFPGILSAVHLFLPQPDSIPRTLTGSARPAYTDRHTLQYLPHLWEADSSLGGESANGSIETLFAVSDGLRTARRTP